MDFPPFPFLRIPQLLLACPRLCNSLARQTPPSAVDCISVTFFSLFLSLVLRICLLLPPSILSSSFFSFPLLSPSPPHPFSADNMSGYIQHQQVHPAAIGQIPVPHGPETGAETETYPMGPEGLYTEEQEREIFKYITHPDDSFDETGTYWADLPLMKRISFVNKVNNAEALSELKATWSLFKRDPLGPVSWYFRNAVLPGAGLGLEGYVLFSIGNLSPLFASAWPQCWSSSKATECNKNWIAAVTYLEVVGIMIGQASVGVCSSFLPFF